MTNNAIALVTVNTAGVVHTASNRLLIDPSSPLELDSIANPVRVYVYVYETLTKALEC